MAPSLWQLAFCLGRNPGLARGPGNGLKPNAMAMAQALRPRQWPEAQGHGHGLAWAMAPEAMAPTANYATLLTYFTYLLKDLQPSTAG